MGTKFLVEIDAEKSPNAVGELLRKEFFAEEIGCYSCFDWAEGVESLPDLRETDCWGELAIWHRGRKKIGETLIECRYFWDGDGFLVFGFPDGTWLVNYDCKKNHGWSLTTEVP